MKAHPLDPDAGPHTGALTEDDVGFDDSGGHDHQGASDKGKKVDLKDVVDTDSQLLTGAQKTDLTDGGTTVLHQHAGATTAAVEIVLTNETGSERSAGDVVMTDPDNDESFIGTSGSPGYQGKVLVVAETIATSGSGRCWERGGPFDIDVVGAVNRNDGLRTSATIYKAEAAPSVINAGVFAIALSSSGSDGGTVKAVFLDGLGGHAKQHDLSDPLAHTGGIEEGDIDPLAVTFAKLAANAKSQVLFDVATNGTTTTSTVHADMDGSSLWVTVPTGQTADIFLIALMSAKVDTGGERTIAKIRNVTDANASDPYGATTAHADERVSLVVLWYVLGATGTKEFRIQWRTAAGCTSTAYYPKLVAVVVPT